MPDVVTRRARRSNSSSVNVPPVSAPIEALSTFLTQLREIERRGDFRILGRLSRAQIVRPEGTKTIDFRKDGPVLAFATGSEQLIVTTPWQGIPARWDDTEEFCKACLSDCDICGATGKKLCEAYKCGGAGRVPIPSVICPGDDCLNGGLGERNPQCDLCHGTGIFVGTQECKVCAGTGKAMCSVCRGTGKRPTGIRGGSTNYREPSCSECKGSKFAHREIPQEIAEFVNARIGEMVALGPLVRFAVDSVGGEGTPPKVYDVTPDSNGQYLAMLIEREDLESNPHMFMFGGVLTLRS